MTHSGSSPEQPLLDSSRCQLTVSSDPPFRILLASTRWLEVNGFKESEVVGKPVTVVQGAGTCAATASIMASALEVRICLSRTPVKGTSTLTTCCPVVATQAGPPPVCCPSALLQQVWTSTAE